MDSLTMTLNSTADQFIMALNFNDKGIRAQRLKHFGIVA